MHTPKPGGGDDAGAPVHCGLVYAFVVADVALVQVTPPHISVPSVPIKSHAPLIPPTQVKRRAPSGLVQAASW